MNPKSEINLQEVIQEIASSTDADAQVSRSLLQKHMVELADWDATTPIETIKQIQIALSEEGNVTIATSMKIPNIKFRLGEFLLEAISIAVTASSSSDTPVKLVLAGLKFLQKVRELATVMITPTDAEVLIAVQELTVKREIPTVDMILEYMGKEKEKQVAKALETLENLACITVSMNEILLNESIVIHHAP